jgi:hypothetical protein
MANRNTDLLMFPSVDLHMVMTGGAQNIPLLVDVVVRTLKQDDNGVDTTLPYDLHSVRATSTFTFVQPHLLPPNRFKNQPTVNLATGEITAPVPGVYLFQVGVTDTNGDRLGSLVGRLQVHKEITDWWFGNTTLTTALDPKFAHTEPSIYASFTPDPATGTDLVGDITGHNYVTLISADPAKVAVQLAPEPPTPQVTVLTAARTAPRLRGKVEVLDPAAAVTVTGSFLGKTREVKVRVVNYDRTRTTLESIPHPDQDVAKSNDRFNILFLPEGFRAQDAALFDAIVKQAAADLFSKPRHEPYGMLKPSFNLFKAFEPSQEQQLTTGYSIQEKPAGAGAGARIPAQIAIAGAPRNTYTLRELVERVGMPMQGEARLPAQLRDLWFTKLKLPNLEVGRLDDAIVNAWKIHQAEHIAQTSDTAFGLYVGPRWGDGGRVSLRGIPPIVLPTPIVDNPDSAAVRDFIARVYTFFQVKQSTEVRLDPRRHALELVANDGELNPGNSVLKYLGGLRSPEAPALAIGQNWVPAANQVRRSRGLVALICYDPVDGGQNINQFTMTALTVDNKDTAPLVPAPQVHPSARRRADLPPPAAGNPTGIAHFGNLVDTLAHEFGHSFNLGDEYEVSDDDSPFTNAAADLSFDNVARLGAIKLAGAANPRAISSAKVKWFKLPRIVQASRLTAPSVASTAVAGGIEVTVGPAEIGKWISVFQLGGKVDLRAPRPGFTNQQLPLPDTAATLLTGMTIARQPNATRGSFIVVPSPRPATLPVFPKGSTVYLPHRDLSQKLVVVVPPQVLAFFDDPANPFHNLAINLDRDNVHARLLPPLTDEPVPIPHLTPPTPAFRLVGIFEGADHFAGGSYRATGACKMRDQAGAAEAGEFCFVCKWLIVNLVNPSLHAAIDAHYPEVQIGV